MAAYSVITVARFWSKVQVGRASQCWVWTGAVGANGYGSFKAPETSFASGAHRVALEIATGERLGKKIACHSCDNPLCCNPAHLYVGSHSDNGKDAVDRGLLLPRSQAGAKNGNAKLTESDIRVIRNRIADGETNVRIARDFPVSHAMISKIRRGHFWRDAG